MPSMKVVPMVPASLVPDDDAGGDVGAFMSTQ